MTIFYQKQPQKFAFFFFDVLSDLCPANFSENLDVYETTCIYDGSAFLTYNFEQLDTGSTDIDSLDDLITNVKSLVSNLKLLGETILDEDSFSFIISSVRSGIHDCFYRNLTTNSTTTNSTTNSTELDFDIDAFYSSLPGCSSYCVFPGASCSEEDDCELTMTFEELIDFVQSGSSTIQMNVIIFIGSIVLLFLSI